MKIKIIPVLMAVTLTFYSCNNKETDNQKPTTDSVSAIREMLEDHDRSLVDDEDAAFAISAALAGHTDVATGQLAESKAMSASVKAYAKMMVRDHEKVNEKLTEIANSKNIVLPDAPTEAQQKQLEDLKMKSRNEFDKAYITMMVKDHNKVVEDFKKASASASDTAIRAFATLALPGLLRHQKEAKKIKTELDQ